jgi:hypothetical protein
MVDIFSLYLNKIYGLQPAAQRFENKNLIVAIKGGILC